MLLVAHVLVRQQQIDRRQLVLSFRVERLLVGRFELLDHFLRAPSWGRRRSLLLRLLPPILNTKCRFQAIR